MAVPVPPSIHAFWSAFAATLGQDPSARFYEASYFGDTPEAADELAALVLAGRKRATAGLVWAYEAEGAPLPKPGGLTVVTLFSGQPVCVIETVTVQVVPFCEVDADFAATEGEGDGSLAYWQRAHQAFFERACQRLGREFSRDAPVVCERFVLVYRGSHLPERGQILWTGRARDTVWQVRFSASIAGEVAGDASQQAPAMVWDVEFQSESGETFVRTWSPADRILFGTLPGWPKATIGSLKRALIAWK